MLVVLIVSEDGFVKENDSSEKRISESLEYFSSQGDLDSIFLGTRVMTAQSPNFPSFPVRAFAESFATRRESHIVSVWQYCRSAA